MQNPETPTDRVVVPPRGGLMHVIDASSYSIAGMRRLWGETAARLEFLAALGTAILFMWSGAAFWHWFVAFALFAMVLAIEALNTAIEVLTDRQSPEWSQMAKDAKDLGSLAVGLMLLITGSFVLAVVTGLV